MPDAAADVPAEIAFAGEWRIEPAKANETVTWTLRYPPSASNSSGPIAVANLGLTIEALAGAAHPIRFELRREAGTFVCQGIAEAGRGSGGFRFKRDPGFATAVAGTGLPRFTLRKQIVAAIFDVSSSFVRAIVETGVPDVTFSQLIALKMFRIEHEDVSALHACFPSEGLDDIVTLAMMRVTPAYVQALRHANIGNLDADNVAALRASGIDQAFIEGLKTHGREGLSIDEVVSLHSHEA